MLRMLAFAWAIALWPLAATAQFATLVADNVRFDGRNTVIATGNVEILYEGKRLLANRLIYNRDSDRLDLEGPITLIENEGAVLLADSGQIDGDLRNGILRGARLVLDGQMQLAAVEINRVDGRYNQLYKTVASSCNVCAHRPVPLWQIRARRIVHDQEEKQLYFDDARFEVVGVPIAYLPRLRLPDPTVERYTGFLTPQIKSTSDLGTGFKMPYFITLGKHADLTLTPFISGATRTLEGRFRQELSFGSIEINGAISEDDLLDQPRTYLFADGRFNLPADFKMNVDVDVVSDTSYLLAYGYSDADRLSSGVEITRTRRNEYISASFQKLRSLRSGEVPIEDTLATLLGRAVYERRVFPNLIRGEARFVFDIEGHERIADSIDPTLAAACVLAGATECSARDVLRAGASVGWHRDWTLNNGMIFGFDSDVSTDFYWISQDNTYQSELAHLTPTAAVNLRWPLARTTASGAREVFEPMMQIAWTDSIGANVPNEDSRIVEFDDGNLFALNRFPGSDRYERGWRATLGFNWNRFEPGGREYALTMGRVIRAEDLGQFNQASGLDGGSSDWLVSGRIKLDNRLSLANRSLFDDNFNFAKSETQIAWNGERFSATGSYTWVVEDPTEERLVDTSEINFDASYALTRHWTASAEGRYDVNTNKATSAGFGLEYTNECLNVDFSVSRRFTSSVTVEPTTDFGLSVSLNGFGRDGRANARTCNHVKG